MILPDMSTHIGAPEGAIAETVLLPGDPLRAKFVAERFLDRAVCYNEVRGMLGFTGFWKGRRLSVQGTGMGQPSMAIYATELMREYGAKSLIRIGSCGALQPEVKVRDVVIAVGASTDSRMNRVRFAEGDFAPIASARLLRAALERADRLGLAYHAGGVLSTDSFYQADPESWRLWASYGTLAVEMETSALYTLAARHGVEALALLTVSDSLVTHEETTSKERETGFDRMVELALSLAE